MEGLRVGEMEGDGDWKTEDIINTTLIYTLARWSGLSKISVKLILNISMTDLVITIIVNTRLNIVEGKPLIEEMQSWAVGNRLHVESIKLKQDMGQTTAHLRQKQVIGQTIRTAHLRCTYIRTTM